MSKKIPDLKKEIENCNKYHYLKIRCDVLNSEGNPCNESVEPMICFDSRATKDNNFNWEYQRAYHTGFSCKKHGCVPISINGKPTCYNKPEEVFGEFKQVLQAELKGKLSAQKETAEKIQKLKEACDSQDLDIMVDDGMDGDIKISLSEFIDKIFGDTK